MGAKILRGGTSEAGSMGGSGTGQWGYYKWPRDSVWNALKRPGGGFFLSGEAATGVSRERVQITFGQN